MSTSKIEWTDETWNPTTGCAKVSAGCKNCYAEVMSKRLAGMGQEKYQGIMTDGGRFNGRVRTHDDELSRPYTWKKPRKVFVNSMSDLFHEDVPFTFIYKVFMTMERTPQHTYQILTKRPERMLEFLKDYAQIVDAVPNVWLGTSVENQDAANERIPHLLKCPAAVRFLSCEPLVGQVDLKPYLWLGTNDNWCGECGSGGRYMISPCDHFCNFKKIHWVIAGGESGPGARPMHPLWARILRDQCAEAGIPFFFKQWGMWVYLPDVRDASSKNEIVFTSEGKEMVMTADPTAVIMKKIGKAQSGNLLDGRMHEEFPQTPKSKSI